MKYPCKRLFGFTWVGWLNITILQWIGLRLAYGNGWRLLRWIVPTTGWWNDFSYLKRTAVRCIIPLLLIANLAYGQVIDVKPVICSKTISTTFMTQGNDTIYSLLTTEYDSVAIGAQVFGPGIKIGTTVEAILASGDSLVLSDTVTTTQDSVDIQIQVARAAPYSSGDWLGFPFLLPNLSKLGTGGTPLKLISATITDIDDAITATDIVFFSLTSGNAGLDNAAVAITDNDEWGILGLTSATVVTDMGALKILTKDDINLAIERGISVWGRLIARGAPSFTTTQSLRVRLRFQ